MYWLFAVIAFRLHKILRLKSKIHNLFRPNNGTKNLSHFLRENLTEKSTTGKSETTADLDGRRKNKAIKIRKIIKLKEMKNYGHQPAWKGK